MPSKRTSGHRGNLYQDEIEKFFLGLPIGAIVHNQKPVGRRIFTPKGVMFVSSRNDIFGAFDLIVSIPGRRVKFIQATLHTSPGMKKKPIDNLPWNDEHSSFELWQKIPHKGSRIMVKVAAFEGWEDLGVINLKDVQGRVRDYFQIK